MSIKEKLDRYFASERGQKRVRNTLSEYAAAGRKRTAAGSELANEETFREMTDALRDFILTRAAADDVPGSVLENIASLVCMPSKMTGDKRWHEIRMYFADDYGRPSLYEEGGYDGVRNIIALFNNGYVASQYVYGAWDGHRPTGEAAVHSYSIETSPHVRSRIGRPTLEFMQQAIVDFNAKYGAKYKIDVRLSPIYEPDNHITTAQ